MAATAMVMTICKPVSNPCIKLFHTYTLTKNPDSHKSINA